MDRKYTYAELCRMKKKRVIRIAGFDNMKQLSRSGFNKELIGIDPITKQPQYKTVNASKKYIAKIIASDR